MSTEKVNHPSHYNGYCSMECIDVMTLAFGKEQTRNFCAMNAFKYLWRYKAKNGEEDVRKAEWYLDYAVNRLGLDQKAVVAVFIQKQLDKADKYFSDRQEEIQEEAKQRAGNV